MPAAPRRGDFFWADQGGTGIYGMSTALWMLEDGGYEVTIVDRCETLPALDAASTGTQCSCGG